MMGAAVAAMAIGAGAQMYGAKKGSEEAAGATKESYERSMKLLGAQQAAQQHSVEKAEAAVELGQDRVVASEMARFNLMAGLGMPGTYEESYEDFIAGLGGQSPFIPGGLSPKKQAKMAKRIAGGKGAAAGMFKKTSKTITTPGGGPIDPETGMGTTATSEITDYKVKPGILAQKVGATRSGRMVSYMTAQADQLVRREGPLYEEIKQSVHGPIIEGAGMQHQQMMEEIETMAAKSGSARNRAVQAATQIAASQQIHRDRQNMLWNANLQLIKFSMENARIQMAFNDQWISGRAGVRDQFNQMMNHFTDLRVNTIMAAEIGAQAGVTSNYLETESIRLKSDLIKADNTKNMWAMGGGALKSIGGLMMGNATMGGAGSTGVGAPKSGLFGSGLGASAVQRSGFSPAGRMPGQPSHAASTWTQ
jgi:hypothetical protein